MVVQGTIVPNRRSNQRNTLKWEYLTVKTDNRLFSGRIVSKVNGERVAKQVGFFLQLPSFDEYLNQLGKDGWELLSEIRNHAETANLMCVAVTAFHTSKTREDALRAGFDAYFSKPLDATHFSRELASLL